MARLFEIKFKYRKALEIYERCLEPICEVFGAHSLHVAHIHSTMGLLATKLGEYTRAEGSLTKALQIREQIVDASDEEDYCGYYQLLSESC
jgi:tetratricopeptide (TPR) repeat protein